MWAVQREVLTVLALAIVIAPQIYLFSQWEKERQDVERILREKGLPIPPAAYDGGDWLKASLVFALSLAFAALLWPG